MRKDILDTLEGLAALCLDNQDEREQVADAIILTLHSRMARILQEYHEVEPNVDFGMIPARDMRETVKPGSRE